MKLLATLPLLLIDDLRMRRVGPMAAEELLEIAIRRYEHASTLLTANRPVEDYRKLFGDRAAVTAMLDRPLHHGHGLKCGPRSRRAKLRNQTMAAFEEMGLRHSKRNFSSSDAETGLGLEILKIGLVREESRRGHAH